MPAYDVTAIEEKWQDRWESERTFYVSEDPDRAKFYNVQMYPYPSGDLHMGHLRNYGYLDLLTRYRRMQGFNVLAPMGWDSFGLPAENAAIQTGIHPRVFTEEQIARMKVQLRRLGAVYDWDRELASHTPEYYRWDQWLFLRLFERGLAYKKMSPVNWCPNDQTVLANEQVVDGRCDRCGHEVEKRDLEQWFFRITEYADRLLADLDQLDEWPDRVRTMQENWIGRSEGLTFTMEVAGTEDAFEVFTTRPDTVFGMTFAVLAPEHPLVAELVAGTEYEEEVERYAAAARKATEIDAVVRGWQDRRLHRAPCHKPRQWPPGTDLRRRVRADDIRDRGDHGGPRPGPARLGVRRGSRVGDHSHRPAPGRLGGSGLPG